MNPPMTEDEVRSFFQRGREAKAERMAKNPPMTEEEAYRFAERCTLRQLARGFPVAAFCLHDPPRTVKGPELRDLWKDRIEAERRALASPVMR